MGKNNGHTPGPWMLRCGFQGRPYQITATDITSISATRPITNWAAFSRPADPESLANARLMAAAPELLDACREAALQIEYLHEKFKKTGSGANVVARLWRAIAAATGDAP